ALREPWQWTVSADPGEHTRRGLYVLVRRNFRFPMFEVFDTPINSVSSPRRDVTIVTPQTLWSLNNARAWRQAQEFAARVVREAGPDQTARVTRAWKIALVREPSESERAEALALVAALARDARDVALDSPPADLARLPAAEATALAKLCLAIL